MMLMVAFAFATFSFSNQSFAADAPNAEVLTCAIGTITATYQCNGTGSYTGTFTVPVASNLTGTVTLSINGGTPVNGAYNGSDDVMIMISGITDFSGSINALASFQDNDSGGDCSSDNDPSGMGTGQTLNDSPTDCSTPPACPTCYADGASIQDANGYTANDANTYGGELCGGDLTFTGNGALLTNGTVTGGRTVTITAATSVTMTQGTMFDASGGGMITVTVNGSVSCLTDEDGQVTRRLVVDHDNVEVTAGVKVTPNPFSSSATIDYNLDTAGEVLIRVFNMKGEPVAVLANGVQVAGQHSVRFDAANLPKGFYYLSLQTSTEQVTEQMVIMR